MAAPRPAGRLVGLLLGDDGLELGPLEELEVVHLGPAALLVGALAGRARLGGVHAVLAIIPAMPAGVAGTRATRAEGLGSSAGATPRGAR